MKSDVRQFSFAYHFPNGTQINLNIAVLQDSNYVGSLKAWRGLLQQAIAELDEELAEKSKQ